MIDFRNRHPVIRRNQELCTLDIPAVSTHGYMPWMNEFSWESKQVGVMYAGKVGKKNDIVYMMLNVYWEWMDIELPKLPGKGHWVREVDTGLTSAISQAKLSSTHYRMSPRSAIVLRYV